MSSVSLSEPEVAIARSTGFSECVIALRRALSTTPVGWLLAVWFCWGRVPSPSIVAWLVIAATLWGGSLLVLQRVIGSGSSLQLHRRRVHWVAGLDGFAWALLVWFLVGHDPVLDALLMALLCGVVSVNAQVYGTYVTAYYRQIGILWGVAVLGLLQADGAQSALDYVAGLTVFIALTGYYTRAISKRLFEGIRLRHANGLLAEQLRAALQKVELDAATDALTGHWNRRALDDILERQRGVHAASGIPFSILILDIDFFKHINDRFGHLIGDDVLRAFAQRLREFVRAGDLCARFGGEEFVIVLPATNLLTALHVAERIRQGVAQAPLLAMPRVQATVSIGVATIAHGQTTGDLLSNADNAVYLAKKSGRDQVRSAPQGRVQAEHVMS